MTLIIRAPGRIASPLPGSFDPPSLGVTGIFSRFLALGAAATPGDVVTTVKDQVGTHDVSSALGVVKFEEVDGVPVISLAAAGRNRLISNSFSGLPKGRTIAMLARLSGNPAATEQLVSTIPSKAALSILSWGALSLWGDTVPFLYTPVAPAPKPGWFIVVASLGADGVGKIAVNGAITTGPNGYADSVPASTIKIEAPDTVGLKFVDLAIIDHAVTDVEIASITAGLGTWLL
jgi:hypothetical protein